MFRTRALAITLAALLGAAPSFAETVKIGLNYPVTGPYEAQGLDQRRAADLAAEEINKAGGILGKQIELLYRDTKSQPPVATANAIELIDKEGVKMIFGGSASNVAAAVGKVAQEKKNLFFGTLTYSTTVTAEEGQKHLFRECYDSWAAAKTLSDYMTKNFAGKKFLYITADYNWGHSTERAFRKFTNTNDETQHRRILTPFPTAKEEDFKKAVSFAKLIQPDVLVMVLFGTDMISGIRLATAEGLKSKMQIVVPNLTLGMAEGAGPKVMEGVIGAIPWTAQVPQKYGHQRGQQFVDAFATKYNRWPDTSGASAYTILHEYKAAVERAGTFDSEAVIKTLEGHKYTLLKDEQYWRDFDHQSIQTVYAVKCRPEAEVLKDKYKLDYFEIIGSMEGEKAFRTRQEWEEARKAAGLPPQL
jgi:branched-chain amino acid transport system substrate-binding protein